MKSYLIGLVVLALGVSVAHAIPMDSDDDDKSGDNDDDSPKPAEPKGTHVMFRASGTHKCQSRSSIGHTCDVSGMKFHDCKEAYFSLKNEDCCPESEYGGHSIEFTMGPCGPL